MQDTPIYTKFKSGGQQNKGFNVLYKHFYKISLDDSQRNLNSIWNIVSNKLSDFQSYGLISSQQGDEGYKFDNQSDFLSSLVQSVTVPEVSTPDGQSFQTYLFEVKNQSMRYTFGDLTMTFVEPIGLPVQLFHKLWIYKRIFNPWTGHYGLVEEYKVNMTVEFIKIEENGTQPSIYTWKFYGVFPKSINVGGDISYDSTDFFQTSITYSVDYFTEE